MSENQGSGMMAGFLFGAVVGAGAALLLAPASGSDTRHRIKVKAEELRQKSISLKDRARGKLDEMGHSMGEGAKELKGAVREGRDAFQMAADDAASRSKQT